MIRDLLLIICVGMCAGLLIGVVLTVYELGKLEAVVKAQQKIIVDLQTTHNTQSASH